MTNYIVICFENFAVRGELVTVSETLQQILGNHTTAAGETVLAELLVATSLLTALKFAGDITVQLGATGR